MDILDINLAVKKAEQKLVKEGKIGNASYSKAASHVTVTTTPNEELGGLGVAIIEGTCAVQPTDLSVSLYNVVGDAVTPVDTREIKGVVRNAVHLGNRTLIGEENDKEHLDNIPWLVIIDFDKNATMFIDRHPREMEFEFSREFEQIKHIDQKYIPVMDSITMNGTDGKWYKLTDSDGSLNVAEVV